MKNKQNRFLLNVKNLYVIFGVMSNLRFGNVNSLSLRDDDTGQLTGDVFIRKDVRKG